MISAAACIGQTLYSHTPAGCKTLRIAKISASFSAAFIKKACYFILKAIW
jgi:hypothetical protein